MSENIHRPMLDAIDGLIKSFFTAPMVAGLEAIAGGEPTNENALEGIRCPKCGSEEPFQIQATAWFHVTDDGTDHFEEVEWDEDAPIKCVTCDHTGTVRDFRLEAGS